MRDSRPLSWRIFLLLAVVFSLQVVPQILAYSMVTDEAIEITDGYFYWDKGELWDHFHPPLAKALQAFPLRFMGLKTDLPPGMNDLLWVSDEFIWMNNRDRIPEVLFLARCVSWLFGLALGGLFFLATRENRIQSIAALTLWAFEPNFLAFSSLAYADIPVTSLCLAAVLVHRKSLKDSNGLLVLGAGALAGAAACAKYSALAILPILAILEMLYNRRSLATRGGLARLTSRTVVGAAGFMAAVGLVFFLGTWKAPNHPIPWKLFLDGLAASLSYPGHPGFLFGEIRTEIFPHYYLVALALKTTVPFMAAFVFAFLGHRFLGKLPPFWTWGSGLLFIAAVSLFVHNTGFRHALPAMPFLILTVAWTVGRIIEKTPGRLRRAAVLLLAGLGVIHAVGSLASFPSELTYFSEFVPARLKSHLLADSNLDIGQENGLFAREALARGFLRVKAAYLGGERLSAYGLPYKEWTGEDGLVPQKGWVYAMNIGYAQLATGFWKDAPKVLGGWPRRIPPTGKIGETWFYWDFSKSPPREPPQELKKRTVR